MISFRVSEREFELLKTKSEAEGARSISDFARLALCNPVSESDNRIDQGITQLNGEVQQLSAEIRRMTELLDASHPPPALAARHVNGTPRANVAGRGGGGPSLVAARPQRRRA